MTKGINARMVVQIDLVDEGAMAEFFEFLAKRNGKAKISVPALAPKRKYKKRVKKKTYRGKMTKKEKAHRQQQYGRTYYRKNRDKILTQQKARAEARKLAGLQ